MKSIFRLAFTATLISLTPLSIAAPHAIDVHRELVRYRAANHGVAQALAHNTTRFVDILLEDPRSPYSELDRQPSIVNEVWWLDFVQDLPIDAVDKGKAALETLQWQLGFTKARPDEEVIVSQLAASLYRGKEAAANALKAGVDADIFWKARDLNGSLSTVAAAHAVALQLLRDAVSTVAPADHDAAGIKAGVLERYLKQDRPGAISEYDLRYLNDLLNFAIGDRRLRIDAKGKPQLPAHFRVSRVAAAYSDAAGYVVNGICNGNAPSLQPDKAPGSWPLCFIAATDRAVHAWYRREKHRETEALIRARHRHESDSGFFTLLTVVLALADLATFLEPVEASFVDDFASSGELAEADAEFAGNRSNRLTCRIKG